MRSRFHRSLIPATALFALAASTGCASDRPARGGGGGGMGMDMQMDMGSDGGGMTQAAPPDLAVAVDQLQLREVDLEVSGLTLDLRLNLSFLGIVTAEVRLDAAAEELKLKVGELLGDVRVDARLGILLSVIEDIVTLFEENPELLQRLQLRMQMGSVTGMGGDGGVPGAGGVPGMGGAPGAGGGTGGGVGGSGGAPAPTPG